MFAGYFLPLLLKCVLYFFREIRSRQWKRVPATITSCLSHKVDEPPVVTLTYKITLQDGNSRATTKIPFVLFESADAYALRFKKDQQVIVRVDPTNPSHTLFVDSDQK
jgi:hypothetical protein